MTTTKDQVRRATIQSQRGPISPVDPNTWSGQPLNVYCLSRTAVADFKRKEAEDARSVNTKGHKLRLYASGRELSAPDFVDEAITANRLSLAQEERTALDVIAATMRTRHMKRTRHIMRRALKTLKQTKDDRAALDDQESKVRRAKKYYDYIFVYVTYMGRTGWMSAQQFMDGDFP